VRDAGEQVLVQVAESFPLGREALVTEALEEVALVQADRGVGILAAADLREALEQVGVEVELDVAAETERVLVGLEPVVGRESGGGEAGPDEPQRLAERCGRWAARVGPELGGDGVAQPQAR